MKGEAQVAKTFKTHNKEFVQWVERCQMAPNVQDGRNSGGSTVESGKGELPWDPENLTLSLIRQEKVCHIEGVKAGT